MESSIHKRKPLSPEQQIRERDAYICQQCGAINSRHVHHINYDKKDCRPLNLITLCHACNNKVNKDRGAWTWRFVMAKG